ncbi:MAG: sll0787 family AIR synthase-like protein [Sulfitobacter sp.]
MNDDFDITTQAELKRLTDQLASARGVTSKTDIAATVAALGLSPETTGRPGDDCAALPDDNGGWTLFAGEGFIPGFVNADPWFAGWCGVMVNISDVLAMGGTPTAVVNAIWAPDAKAAQPVLAGMAAAAQAYGVPIVGGHSNLGADELNLSVTILGHAKQLMTSFDAAPEEVLICAIDHRGAYRAPFDNWQAALDAPHQRLRDDAALLARLAATGMVTACKDISQAGIPGTALMLAECSGAGVEIDVASIPLPPDVPLAQWMRSFPSFGFLMTTTAENAASVIQTFTDRDICAAPIGRVTTGSKVTLSANGHSALFWDYRQTPYMTLSPTEPAYA